jgi:hypothetical protein
MRFGALEKFPKHRLIFFLLEISKNKYLYPLGVSKRNKKLCFIFFLISVNLFLTYTKRSKVTLYPHHHRLSLFFSSLFYWYVNVDIFSLWFFLSKTKIVFYFFGIKHFVYKVSDEKGKTFVIIYSVFQKWHI